MIFPKIMTEATCETRSFDLPNPGRFLFLLFFFLFLSLIFFFFFFRILDASQIQQSSNTLIIQDKLQNLNQLHAQGIVFFILCLFSNKLL